LNGESKKSFGFLCGVLTILVDWTLGLKKNKNPQLTSIANLKVVLRHTDVSNKKLKKIVRVQMKLHSLLSKPF
jgi:hypothetical protein